MRKIRLAAIGLTVLLLLTSAAAGGQSPAPTPSPAVPSTALGTAADALAWLGSVGFTHVESTSTADGRSRWSATLPMTGLGADVTVELVGSPDALTSVTLDTTLSAGSAAGSVIVVVVQRFAPDSLQLVVDVLLRGTFLGGIEARSEGPNGTVTVALSRTEAELPGDVTMPVSITIERPAPVAQASPEASASVTPTDINGLFPTAAEVSEALGLEVEAMGIRDDMSQLWEGTELPPDGLLAKRVQGYRWIAPAASGAPGDVFAGVSVDIDRFATAEDAAKAAAHLSAAFLRSTLTRFTPFATGLSGDLVTAGSMTSDEGFGGSTILVQDGPLVVIVVAVRTGATEQKTEAERITALILARARGE